LEQGDLLVFPLFTARRSSLCNPGIIANLY
jgi:hypothetical protein